MAADVVDLDTLEKRGAAPLFFALWSMGTARARSASGSGSGLALFGFDPKAANGPSEIAALTLYRSRGSGFSLVPWHFPITPARHAELREGFSPVESPEAACLCGRGARRGATGRATARSLPDMRASLWHLRCNGPSRG
jgi:hypothetical protein